MNPYQQNQGGYPAPPSGQPGAYPPGGYPGGQGQQYPPPYGQPGVGGYPAPSGPQPGGYPPPQQPQQFQGGFQQPQGPQGYGFPPQQQGNKLQIPGGLTPGRMIVANLTPHGTFAINFRHSETGDIAFHFNPRLNDQVVVRNTQVNGGWQHEERQQPSFPFRNGQPCNIMILCEPTQFKVAVNGQHYIEYRLRTPGLQLIQFVELTGDLSNGSLQLQ